MIIINFYLIKYLSIINSDDNNFNELVKIKAKYLLPYPYISSKLPNDCKI